MSRRFALVPTPRAVPVASALPLAALALALASAVPAHADVAPPVDFRLVLDEPGRAAAAGEVLRGTFEVRVGEPGVLDRYEVVGKGWDVLEIALPGPAFVLTDAVVRIPFRAVPLDPEAPFGLRVRHDDRPATRVWPLGPEARARAGKPATLVARPGTVRVVDGGTRGSTIRVSGRLVYQRPGLDLPPEQGGPIPAQDVPADSVRVILWDEDDVGVGGTRELIWAGWTNSDGEFDSGDHPWSDCDITCDDPDLVLVLSMNTHVVDVHDTSFEEFTYFFELPEIEDFTGSHYHYGELIPGDPAMNVALHMFTTTVRAHRFLETVVGLTPDKVEIEWPELGGGNAGGYYEWWSSEIHVGPERQWEEGLILHEYGHHFLEQWTDPPGSDYCNLYCDGEDSCTGGACEDPGHCNGCPENDQVAWNEGFSHYMADTISRWIESTYTGADGEPFRVLYPRDEEDIAVCCQDGEEYRGEDSEAAVAAFLRDIDDDNFDRHAPLGANEATRDMLCMGPVPIFQTVAASEAWTVEEFLFALSVANVDKADGIRLTADNIEENFGWGVFPPDTQVVGPVVSLDSPTHPLGVGGHLPCIVAAWDPPDDDSNGVCNYRWQWGTTPDLPVGTDSAPTQSLGCKLAETRAFTTLGEKWFGIRTRECGQDVGDPAVFGPFEILDCNGSGLVDICDISCDHTGYPATDEYLACDIPEGACDQPGCGQSSDCNANLAPDECDIADGTSEDCNQNGIPDECEPIKHWNGGPGNWIETNNWREGAHPVDGDHVCIPATGNDDLVVNATSGNTDLEILACGEDLALTSGAQLTLGQASWVNGTLLLSGLNTKLTVDDRLDVHRKMAIQGATTTNAPELLGSGTTWAHDGLNVVSGVAYLNDHDVVLPAGTLSEFAGTLSARGTCSITLEPSALLRYVGNSTPFQASGASQFLIQGNLTVSAGSGSAGIGAPTVVEGSIHLLDGTLEFTDPTQVSGTVTADPGATIQVGCGGQDYLPGSLLQADVVEFTGGGCGARNIRGIYDAGVATHQYSGSPVTFTTEATIVDYGDDILITGGTTTFNATTGGTVTLGTFQIGGTVNLNSGDPIVTDVLTLGGNIWGISPITVEQQLDWPQGRQIRGASTLLTNGLTTIGAGGAAKGLVDRAWSNAGLVNFGGRLNLVGAATIHNLLGGTLNARVDGVLLGSSTPTWTNAGLLVKSEGAGTSSIEPGLTNTGTIEVQVGTLSFRTLTQNAGETILRAGDLAVTSSNFTLNGGSLSGIGTVHGAVWNGGADVEPGLVTPGTLSIDGSYLQTGAGRLVIELGGTAPGAYDRLELVGGAGAVLGGTIAVTPVGSYVPAAGDTFDVLVAPSASGFVAVEAVGFPAGLSARRIDSTVGVTVEVFAPGCQGVLAPGTPGCPDAICATVASDPSGPVLSLARGASCPAGAPYAPGVDMIRGSVSSLSISSGEVQLVIVDPVVCGGTVDSYLWGGPPPAPGQADFFLAREPGGDYGTASTGEPRVPSVGDCP